MCSDGIQVKSKRRKTNLEMIEIESKKREMREEFEKSLSLMDESLSELKEEKKNLSMK